MSVKILAFLSNHKPKLIVVDFFFFLVMTIVLLVCVWCDLSQLHAFFPPLVILNYLFFSHPSGMSGFKPTFFFFPPHAPFVLQTVDLDADSF